MKDERDIKRKLHGPGGHKCPCCNHWGVGLKLAPLERRLVRRKVRQELKKEVDRLTR